MYAKELTFGKHSMRKNILKIKNVIISKVALKYLGDKSQYIKAMLSSSSQEMVLGEKRYERVNVS